MLMLIFLFLCSCHAVNFASPYTSYDFSGALSLTSPFVPAGNFMYLAILTTKPAPINAALQGMGITWTLVATQCSLRGQTGLVVWVGQGSATGGSVTATFGAVNGVMKSSVISVATFIGGSVFPIPFGLVQSLNTGGPSVTCTYIDIPTSTDSTSIAFPFVSAPMSQQSNLIFISAWRQNTLSSTSITPISKPLNNLFNARSVGASSGDVASVFVTEISSADAGTGPFTISGTGSAATDWAAVVVELMPNLASPMPANVAVPAVFNRDMSIAVAQTSKALANITIVGALTVAGTFGTAKSVMVTALSMSASGTLQVTWDLLAPMAPFTITNGSFALESMSAVLDGQLVTAPAASVTTITLPLSTFTSTSGSFKTVSLRTVVDSSTGECVSFQNSRTVITSSSATVLADVSRGPCEGLPLGAIIGIAIGGTVLAAGVVVLIVFIHRRNRDLYTSSANEKLRADYTILKDN